MNGLPDRRRGVLAISPIVSTVEASWNRSRNTIDESAFRTQAIVVQIKKTPAKVGQKISFLFNNSKPNENALRARRWLREKFSWDAGKVGNSVDCGLRPQFKFIYPNHGINKLHETDYEIGQTG